MHTVFLALKIAIVLFAVVGSVYALVYISDFIEAWKELKKQGRL